MCPDTNSPEDSGRSYEKQPSDLRNQNSDNRGPGAPPPHECPLNRNCRAKCLAWQAGGLPETLRWFRRNHKWHESGPLGNQVKLRLVFKKPIRSAVNKLLADRLDGLTAKIEGVFSKLQKKAEALDNLCVNRINDEDELVMLEHTMAYLDEGLGDLADLIEIGCLTGTGDQTGKSGDACCRSQKQSSREIMSIPANDEQWVTYKVAAGLLGVRKSTVSKWVKKGRLTDNGKKGRKKRLSKTCVLLVKQEIDDEYLKNDAEELRRDTGRIR